MSLSATWVKATDGYFYEEPVLRGEGWFVCFDDDDPPELVIEKGLGLNPPATLREANIGFTHLQFSQECGRDFGGQSGDINIRDAQSFFFELTAPLDPAFITDFDSKQKDKPMGVYYDFEK